MWAVWAEGRSEERLAQWRRWVAETEALAADILARRRGEGVDVSELLREDREEHERRDGWIADERLVNAVGQPWVRWVLAD